MAKLLSDADEINEMIDFFVRDYFTGISSDRYLDDFFASYFKEKILFNAFNSSNLYLSDDEKTLQYSGRNTVEPIAEYFFILQKTDSKRVKRDYAEKGAIFSIVHPVLDEKESNMRYFLTCASVFYNMVSVYSTEEFASKFFDLLSSEVEPLQSGLEEILGNVSKDGLFSLEKFYDSILMEYLGSNDTNEKDNLARKISSFSKRLNINPDDVPLEREHYRYLFE